MTVTVPSSLRWSRLGEEMPVSRGSLADVETPEVISHTTCRWEGQLWQLEQI